MSKPWCLKSEKRVDATYEAIDMGMSGSKSKYTGGAAADLLARYREEPEPSRLSWTLAFSVSAMDRPATCDNVCGYGRRYGIAMENFAHR